MVILRYGFDNPETIKDTHRYLYHDKRFHSFEEAKEFIKDLPATITLKVRDRGQIFITELETNCYILCEGRKIPQIKGKTYELFEYYGSSKFEKMFYANRRIERIENALPMDEEYIKWFGNKFLKKW